jgi:hypothetical protein
MNAEIGKELIDNAEIAHTIIEQMGSQVDLLVTLATAVFGGLIALFIQILIHNSDQQKDAIKFNPKSLRLVMLCLLFEGVSAHSHFLLAIHTLMKLFVTSYAVH